MKQKSARAIAVMAIIFAAYQVLAFAIPFPRNNVFWTSWIFTDIALLCQIYVFRSAFNGTETVKSKFYGFPIAQIGVIYAAAQLILGFVFMALGKVIPMWIALIVYVIMFVVAAVGTISSEAMRDEIVRQDVKLKVDVACIRRLQSVTASLTAQVRDPEAAAAVKKLAEDVRYSDPVSSAATAESEHELSVCIDELQQAVIDGDSSAIAKLCTQAEVLLAERNRICKLSK